jgi:hypothetical protein
MKWASLAVCALGGMLLLVGCQTTALEAEITQSRVDALGSVRLMDGTPDMVALTLQSMLKQRKFDVTLCRNGEDVVLESKTAAGLRFALLLHRIRDSGRDQTRVTLQWDNSSDRKVHVDVMTDLDKQGAKK